MTRRLPFNSQLTNLHPFGCSIVHLIHSILSDRCLSIRDHRQKPIYNKNGLCDGTIERFRSDDKQKKRWKLLKLFVEIIIKFIIGWVKEKERQKERALFELISIIFRNKTTTIIRHGAKLFLMTTFLNDFVKFWLKEFSLVQILWKLKFWTLDLKYLKY